MVISDDAAFFRSALRDILTGGGYEVVAEATNGEEAVDRARAFKPDIIILDVVMPVKTGLEAAREITGLKLPLKIVMCSSLGHDPLVEEAIRAGAAAYILKPLDRAKVLDTLAGL